MNIFDIAFQKYLELSKKGKPYSGSFPFKNNQTGEVITVEKEFYALSDSHAEKISVRIKANEQYKLERGSWKESFGLVHNKNVNPYLKFAQRISGTRGLKQNFNKGLHPGGQPLFAFTRLSYSIISNLINPSKVTPEEEHEVDASPEERAFLRKKMLFIFFLSLTTLLICAGLAFHQLLTASLFSLAGYGLLTITAITCLFLVSSFNGYKENLDG